MKNLDIKKLLVLILIIAIVGLIIFFVVRTFTKEKITDDEKEMAESKIVDYYAAMTYGFNTQYGGIDILYNSDSIVYDDLNPASVLTIATKYLSKTQTNENVSNNVIDILNQSGTYGNLDDASFYTGASIREAIKYLFGIDFENISADENYDFIYDFYYDKEYDTYIMKRNNVTDYSTANEYIDYSIIETTKEKDKIKTNLAIAYVFNDGTNTNYYQDRNGEKIIAENVTEFPKDKINDFDKYTFTLKKADNNNYVFESIEKVK